MQSTHTAFDQTQTQPVFDLGEPLGHGWRRDIKRAGGSG
jgi:hypothetical protein